MGFIDLPNSEIVDNTEGMHVLVSDGKDIKRAELKNENMVTRDTYEGLETENKTVIGAINEVNEKTANAGAKSWNDLEDKPFGEENNKNIFIPETTGTVIKLGTYGDEHISYDANLIDNWTIGNELTIKWDGVEYNCVCKEDSEMGDNVYYFSVDGKYVMFCQYGTIVALGSSYFQEGDTHTYEVYTGGITVHKLDKKYLPDDINADWNTLKNRPFYVGDSKLIKLYENKNYIASGRWTDASNKTGYYTTAGITLLENSEYKVVLDGESYICKSVLYPDKYRFIIGNPAFFSDDLEDNGLPFAVSEDSSSYQYAYIFLGDQSSHEIEISLVDYEIHKIDEKYLPVIIGKQGEVSTADVFNDYNNNIASGDYSHAEGTQTTASGSYSHAQGYGTQASGYASHAEGYETIASGSYSHAQGYGTQASGSHSYAEGDATIASGDYSHAEGSGTIASGFLQHVQGTYNIEDVEGKYIHIVGNGNWDKKSNAHTIDWEGNAWFSGQIFVGGTGQNDKNAVNIVELINQLKADVEALKG